MDRAGRTRRTSATDGLQHARVDRPLSATYIRLLKRPLIREDLKVLQYQSQEADNTFITSDGTSPYNSSRKWAVKRHYREDNNPHPHNDINYEKGVIRVLRHAEPPAGDPNPQARLGAGRYHTRRRQERSLGLPL